MSDDQHEGTTDSPMGDVSFVRHNDIDSLIQALRGLDVPDAEVETFEQRMDEANCRDPRACADDWFESLATAVRTGTLPAASVFAETDPEGWLAQVREALLRFENS